MGLFTRRRRRAADEPSSRDSRRATLEHLRAFASSRVGVEAYVEPATSVTPTTVVLVAVTGEWTRRRVPSREAAWEIARELAIPVYDVHLTGYPQRMREWTSRERRRLRQGS